MRDRNAVSALRRAGRAARTLLLGGALAAAAFVMSATPAMAAQPGPGVREDLVAKIAGKKIHLDKATGKVREITVDEARDLIARIVAMTSRPSEGPEAVVHPDGAQMIAMSDHLGHVVISRYNPDGTVSVRCISTADEAADFLAEEPLAIQ